MQQTKTDPELKGRWTDPPAEKMAIFRRVGIKAYGCFAVSVRASWLCFGRLDPKKIPDFFFWRVWAGFLPLTSHLILGTVLSWGAATKGGAVSCSV